MSGSPRGILAGLLTSSVGPVTLAAAAALLFRDGGRRRTASPAEPDLECAPVIVFDTETSDLPQDFLAPASDLANWPRLVQIAWMECDRRFRVRRAERHMVAPDGFEIAPSASQVHGITTEYARAHGAPLHGVLERFAARLEQAGLVVAHNVDFDEKVVTAESIRTGVSCPLGDVPSFCSMRGTTQVCKLPPMRHGFYRLPTLRELHKAVLDRPHENAHDALSDVEAVVHCLRSLVDDGVLRVRESRRARGADAGGRKVVYKVKVKPRG
jgi:DNA polymerase III epsilon subunit-like protein